MRIHYTVVGCGHPCWVLRTCAGWSCSYGCCVGIYTGVYGGDRVAYSGGDKAACGGGCVAEGWRLSFGGGSASISSPTVLEVRYLNLKLK